VIENISRYMSGYCWYWHGKYKSRSCLPETEDSDCIAYALYSFLRKGL